MNDRREGSGVFAVIHTIRWDRIHLRMEMSIRQEKTEEPIDSFDIFAVNLEGEAGILFDTKILENGRVELYVNITNNGLHECVPAGTYRIFVCKGNDVLAECESDAVLTEKMSEASRAFLYGTQRREYSVSFFVTDDSERLLFRMHMMPFNYQKMGFPYSFSLWKSLSSTLFNYFLETRRNIRRFYQLLCKLQGKKKQTSILFMTEQSKTLGSNLACILERMKERGLDKKYTIRTWARKVSSGGYSPLNWLKFAALVAKSGIIFVDDHVPPFDWMPLEDTILIQTWHAGAGFKSSGYARWGQYGGPAPVSCHRQYTYGLCGSRKIAHFFSEVWGINTERVLNTGMPRMDEFQDEAYRKKTTEELYKKYPLCKGKKVILFAPTYRGNSNRDAHYPYELIDWDRFEQVCGDEYVVLFKMHPWVIKDIKIPKKLQDRMIDVKKYPNINDLFYITDLLITDYSSNIYEYSLMRKPMLFFAYDEIQYSFSRGFHRPYREAAPGKVCGTFDELMDAIEQKDFEYEKVEEYIETQFDHFDSNARDRVIDWILLGQMPEDIRRAIEERDARMDRIRTTDFSAFAEEVEY